MNFPESLHSEAASAFKGRKVPVRNPAFVWALSLVPLVLLPVLAFALTQNSAPWVCMWALAFSIFAGAKWLTWMQWRLSPRHESIASRQIIFLLAWPGMDAKAFLSPRVRVPKPTPSESVAARFKTTTGILILWAIAPLIPVTEPLLRGWVGMIGLILILHFGTFALLSLFWRLRGINAQPLMNRPVLATSLSDFWGRRWNSAFNRLAHDHLFRGLHRQLGITAATLIVFVISGLIHELVISIPARGGYGLPTLYFVFQGLGILLEHSSAGKFLVLGHGLRGRLFTWLVAAGPAFWLFHPPFVHRVIIPFLRAIHAL